MKIVLRSGLTSKPYLDLLLSTSGTGILQESLTSKVCSYAGIESAVQLYSVAGLLERIYCLSHLRDAYLFSAGEQHASLAAL